MRRFFCVLSLVVACGHAAHVESAPASSMVASSSGGVVDPLASASSSTAAATTTADAPCPLAYPPPQEPEPAGSPFPESGAPALSGPYAGLTFGMSEEDARAKAPAIAAALRVYKGADGVWTPIGAGKTKVRIEENVGVSMIEITFPDEKSVAAVTKSWGPPVEAPSRFGWRFWFSPEKHVRAMQMEGADGGKTRLELGLYFPLAPRLTKTGDFFSICGRPILGAPRDAFRGLPNDGDARATTYQLPASEFTGGFYALRVTWKDDRVASYISELGFTYDRELHEKIPKLLEDAWGPPHATIHTRGRVQEHCTGFGDAQVVLCDESPLTIFRLYVGGE